MSLTILSVAFPLAPVGPDAVGGAEQVLLQLDRALVEAGHRSIVIACEGSRVAGELVATLAETGHLDERAKARARGHHREAIRMVLERCPVDLVHLHGHDFPGYLPPPGTTALVTLHLPPTFYGPGALVPDRPHTWLHGVSSSQHRSLPQGPWLLPPIENGVPVAALQARHAKRGFAVMLARICPEKGVHLAIEAARKADVPLLIAGEVFPYEAHQRYFDEEVKPRLDARRRFIGPIGFARKRRLLTAARCLLVPSLAPETSSLVAREALACGTPVVAFANGALPDTIEHGRTGFLVSTVEEMAAAMGRTGALTPEACRAVARKRFSIERMTARYLERYERLAAAAREPARRHGAA